MKSIDWICILLLFAIMGTSCKTSGSGNAQSSQSSSVGMQEKTWKIIVAFADEAEVSEDWNQGYANVVDAFKGTEVQVKYAPSGTDSINVSDTERISIARFRQAYAIGFVAFEQGKEPKSLGDHGGFYDPESPDPIQKAKSYFELAD